MKTNGNGKYLKGTDALARNRRINILHQCGLSSIAIAPHVKLTSARVRQILDESSSTKFYIVDFAQLQDIQQKAFTAASTPIL